jgi:hypothetical protein
MKPGEIRAEIVGTYPVRFQGGSGDPLIVVDPRYLSDVEAWVHRRPPTSRPVALLGAGDMAVFSCDAEEVVRDLLRHTGWYEAERLQVTGFSVGGFPALLYGAMLAAALPGTQVSITTISPLVCMWPMSAGARAERHEKVVRFLSRQPEQRRRMDRYGDARPWITRAAAAAGDRLRIRVLYAAHNERDAAQAGLLAGYPTVTLLPVPTPQHMLSGVLLSEGNAPRLLKMLQSRIAARYPDLQPADLLDRAERVAEAIHALHRDSPGLLELLQLRVRNRA